jgi:putative flippase GtrA
MTGGDPWRTVGFRWLKFNLVGAVGIAVQLAALAALVSSFHVNYLIATALAVETAVIHNFIWHERFTWVDRTNLRPRDVVVRLVRFNLTAGAVSILGNVVLMRLLVGQAGLHYFYANLLAIVACSLINFLMSDRFVFRRPRRH